MVVGLTVYKIPTNSRVVRSAVVKHCGKRYSPIGIGNIQQDRVGKSPTLCWEQRKYLSNKRDHRG